jgi:hypothetical protein
MWFQSAAALWAELNSPSWLKDHQCCLRGTSSGVAIEVCIQFTPLSPEAGPLRSRCCACCDRTWPVDEVDSGVRIRLQIKPPGRLAVRPTVHRHGDEIRTVFEVAEDDAALLVAATSGRRKAQGAPPIGPCPPQSESPAGDAVQSAVRVPGKADEPSGRNSRHSLAYVRHRHPN